jgi:hypothetical protein
VKRVLVTWCIGAGVLVVTAVVAVHLQAPWYASQLSVIGCAIPIGRALWEMR